MSKYSSIKSMDIANGKGVGVSVFLSGCDMDPKCEGCFNSEIWDKDAGYDVDENFYLKVRELLDNNHISHLSILGGDPFADWNLKTTLELCKIADELGKQVWVWTGKRYESLLSETKYMLVLLCVDILVDGRFIKNMFDIDLKWRGSSNQRIIRVQESLSSGEIVVMDE